MGILENDVLVMEPIHRTLSSDAGIFDVSGNPAGSVQTEGSLGSRMLKGVRTLAVRDGDGSLILRVDDVPNLGRDRIFLLGPEGEQWGLVRKEFTFLSKRLTIEVADGQPFSLKGGFSDREFMVTGAQGRAAQVTRRWPGLRAGLLGRERYVLAFTDPDLRHRAVILGAIVALDVMRQKEQSSAAV